MYFSLSEMLNNLTGSLESGYPTGKDIEAAALSLVRLQSVYDIAVHTILSGHDEFNSAKYSWNKSLKGTIIIF